MHDTELDRPHFDLDPYYEGLIVEVNTKKLRLDANNKVHLNLVGYCKKREAYGEAYSQWRVDQGKSPSDGLEKEYDVKIGYSGTYTITVMAIDEESAEEKAINKMDREGMYSYDIDDVEVSEA